MKRIAAVIITIAILTGITSCGEKGKTRHEVEFLMLFDTLTKIVAYTDSEEDFTEFSQLIYDNLKVYHELYDIYKDYPGVNNIKTINDNAGIKPVRVDKKIIDLLLFARDEYKNTNGEINIAFGSVLKIWHKYRTEGSADEAKAALPPMDKLKEASEHTDINKVIIDENNSTVYLDDPEMSLDVGAVGKGFAVEQVIRLAVKNGFTSGLINVGGNICAIGSKPVDNKPWNLGIRNPDKESSNSILKIVYLTDESLVSSGDYERYYTVNGKRYHHIIDPDTLYPAEYFTEVAVICKNSAKADALSTAIFNMPFEKGLKLINNLPDTEALWVLKNGEIKYSDNFEKYIEM